MRYEKHEAPVTLLRQIDNCKTMLDKMPDSGDDPEWFDIRTFGTDCGTFRCWLGDYYHTKQMLQKFRWDTTNTFRHVKWAFGGDIYGDVFTDELDLGTSERKASLQAHLSTMEQRLADWYAVREVVCG